ncbi:MAG: DUF4153 domain-containing protein [Pseudomonadota bacterium]
MKNVKKLQERLRGLNAAVARYTATALFLLAAAVINAIAINSGKDYSKLLLTFAVGAFLSALSQAAYERFFEKAERRMVLIGSALLITAGYYLIIRPAPELSLEIHIRTSVALFALLIAFVWVPSIKSRIDFNESFMIIFKSFFNSLFFSGVIMGGTSAIITAVDQLLVQVSHRAYPHAANIIFILFAPMYFLSLIPLYPGKGDLNNAEDTVSDKEEKVKKAASCPKFLEILVSYILVPIITVFTIILVLYIVRNIGGRFWTNNLLEPILVSYSIAVILLYILASRLENRFVQLYRRVFPKVLVPVVLFQLVASLLKMGDVGIVHTRYYVILYGIFAVASGILLCIIPVRKNGIIAAMLIAFSLVSIIPPVDAFTLSRTNQVHRLESVLLKNNMLEGNTIKPNKSISKEDKRVIVKAFNYLLMMGYNKSIEWLPEKMDRYVDFYETFGFNESEIPAEVNENVFLGLEQPSPVDIKGYDSFIQYSIQIPENNAPEKICDIMKDGKKYTLKQRTEGGKCDIFLAADDGSELIRFDTTELLDRFYNYSAGKSLTPEEASFTKENEAARIRLVVQNMNIEKGGNQASYGAEILILVTVK